MRTFNITNKFYKEMLFLISKGISLSNIATYLAISRPALSQRKQTLIKEGWLVQSRELLLLTPKAIAFIENITLSEQQALADKLNQKLNIDLTQPINKPLRSNGYIIEATLIEQPSKDQLGTITKLADAGTYKLRELTGHTDITFYYNKVYFWIIAPTSSEQPKLMLYAPELIMPFETNAFVMEARIYDVVEPLFLDYEKASKLRLKRDAKGKLSLKIARAEIAIQNDELAKMILEDKEKLKIYNTSDGLKDSPKLPTQDGKLEGLADASFPYEREQVHTKLHQRDTNNVVRFDKALYEGYITPESLMGMNQTLNKIISIQEQTSSLLFEYGKKLNVHLPVLEKMDIVLAQQIAINTKQLGKLPSKPKPIDENQRRLL